MIGVNIVGILRLMRRDEISVYLLEGQQTVNGLRFDPDVMTEYIHKIKTEQSWLTRSDVAERFEASLKSVSRWNSQGKLKIDLTHGKTKCFYQDQVKDIISRQVGNSAHFISCQTP